jgi:hypothetical protein
MIHFSIQVQASEASEALYLIKQWAEDVSNLVCYPEFPIKGEWHKVKDSGAAELRAWMETKP